MSDGDRRMVAGIDAGTECIKALVLDDGREVRGRAVVPTRGYFKDCIQEALGIAIEEAQLRPEDLHSVVSTGFGASCVPLDSEPVTEKAAHARGIFHRFPRASTVVDIGGRAPRVIQIDAKGEVLSSRSARKCAIGIGTFLMFASRHLDVHPTRLMDLAKSAESPAPVGSYCSVFAEIDVIELLRSGASAGEVALGCMVSVAERILEIGGLADPVVVSGGVSEYFPSVVEALAKRSGLAVEVSPEPILVGALGAALTALDALES